MKTTSYFSDKPLVIFFILSFALAWALSLVAVAKNFGLITGGLPLEPFLILGAWTPNMAAFLVLGLVIKRKNGIKSLLLGWKKWQVKPLWYFVSFSPVILGFFTIGLYRLFYGISPATEVLSNPVLLATLLLMVFLTGATGEQLGWRGFALPWLQTKMNALISSIVLGLIWSLWHIPLWFAGIGLESFPFWAYTTIGVSFSVLVTWACNNTRGSLLIASLFHLFLNVSVNMIEHDAAPFLALVFAAYALIITIKYGPEKLSMKDAVPINKHNKSWLD